MDKFIKTDTENVGAEALATLRRHTAETLQDPEDRGRRDSGLRRRGDEGRQQVGVVTSPAVSPRLGTIGLAILDAGVATDGEKVEVAIEGGTAPPRSRCCRCSIPRRRSRAPDARQYEPRSAGRTGPPLCLCWGMTDGELYGVVPNFSEGRRTDVIEAIVEALHVPGARSSTPRPTPTTTGSTPRCSAMPTPSGECAGRSGRGRRAIDMTQHEGGHPRMGAADVIPFMPVRGVSMDAASRSLGHSVASSPRRSTFRSFSTTGRRSCPSGPRSPMSDAASSKGCGTRSRGESGSGLRSEPIGRAGATAVGARKPLVAFNVYLDPPTRRPPRTSRRRCGVQRRTDGGAGDRVRGARTRWHRHGVDEPGRPRGDGPGGRIRRGGATRHRPRHDRDGFGDRGTGAGIGARPG